MEQARKVLTHLGFVDVEGDGKVWNHPDGSVLRVQGATPRFQSSKFQQWGFGQFPYTNQRDGNRMQTLTNKWVRWVRSGGAPPF